MAELSKMDVSRTVLEKGFNLVKGGEVSGMRVCKLGDREIGVVGEVGAF